MDFHDFHGFSSIFIEAQELRAHAQLRVKGQFPGVSSKQYSLNVHGFAGFSLIFIEAQELRAHAQLRVKGQFPGGSSKQYSFNFRGFSLILMIHGFSWIFIEAQELRLHAQLVVSDWFLGVSSKQYSCYKLQEFILQDYKIARLQGLPDCKTTWTTRLQT